MNAKRFFYIAAGLFLLTGAYSLAASRAQGQVSGTHIVGVAAGLAPPDHGGPAAIAVADNGDWYYLVGWDGVAARPWSSIAWQRGGSIGLGTVSAEALPWSRVKGSYRK